MERDRAIEMLIGLVFIVLVFIMILIGLNFGNSKSTSSVISNSYNTVNSHNIVQTPQNQNVATKETITVIQKPTQKTYYYIKDRDRRYYSEYEPIKKHIWDWGTDYSDRNYDSYGRHIKEDKSGYYADTYRVYVYNEGKGDYFTVRFYFEDYWGNEKTYDMRKYVGFKDEGLFYFRDVCKERDQYHNWRYKVLD